MTTARRAGIPRIVFALAALLAARGCTCDLSGGDGCGWADRGWTFDDDAGGGCGPGGEGGATCAQAGGTCVSSFASCPQVAAGYDCASGVCCWVLPDAESDGGPDAEADGEAGADATPADGGSDAETAEAGQDATVQDGSVAEDAGPDADGAPD